MQSLTKPCQSCNKPMNGGMYRANHICPHCFFEHEGGKRSKANSAAAPTEVPPAKEFKVKLKDPASQYIVTEHEEEPAAQASPEPSPEVAPVEAQAPQAAAATKEPKPATESANIVLTTKPKAEQTVLAEMGEVSAECVLRIALTPELFENGKFIGRKSPKVLAALKQGKQNALEQLRESAQAQDANMVTDVAVKNGMKLEGTTSANITVSATGNAIVAELEGCEA
jgi:uncharacterized protein YbjQ (UPF0145 family)